MDALARLKLPGVNFSFNAPFPSALALISQTSLQGSGAALPASRPVGEPNFNASEKGQTWPLLLLRRPLCACPRNATGHYHSSPPFPPHSPSLRHTDPIPRCTGLPYPRSLGIGNSSGCLTILDRGVKVSNGRWCGLQRRGNGCTYTTVAENRFVFWEGGVRFVGNEAVCFRRHSLYWADIC